MSSLPHAHQQDPGPAAEGGSEGVVVHPYEIESAALWAPGRTLGRAFNIKMSGELHETAFSWRAIHIKQVRWRHATHLLLLQGLSPYRLFLASSLQGEYLRSELHLLSYRSDELWRVPYCFHDVVLGQVLCGDPGDIELLLPQMLQRVTKDSC